MPRFFKQHLLTPPHLLPKPEPLLPKPEPLLPAQSEPTPHYSDYDDDDYNVVQDLLVWTAPSRPYRKKDRSFYTVALVLIVLGGLVALPISGPLFGVALMALLFVAFVLDRMPPEDIQYKISTQGVTVDNHFYHWHDLDSFWLGDKDNHQLMYIRTRYRYPALLMVMLGPVAENQIKGVVAHFLPFQEIAPKSMLEDWSRTLQKHFPLETPRR